MTRTDNVQETLHGVEIIDPYRWLEDQESPETRAWIDAQNAHTHTVLNGWPDRERLQTRLTELMKVDTVSTPIARNGVYFFTRRHADQDLPVIYRRVGLEGAEEVLIDPHGLSEDHMTSVQILDVSDDATLLAYGLRQGGEDEIEIHLLDVTTRQDRSDCLPKARYFSLSLLPDKRGFYYTVHLAEGGRIRFHALGTDSTEDTEIFGKGYGPEKLLYAALAEDGRNLLIAVYHGSAAEKTEIYVQNVAEQGPIVPIVNDLNARFVGHIAGDTLYLQTNWEAPRQRVLAVDLGNPEREEWREIVPTSDSVIEWIALAGERLLVSYLENVSSRLRLLTPEGAPLRDVALPTLGSVQEISGRWSSPELFFDFSSFPVPPTIYRYDVTSGEQQIWAQAKVPIEPDRFTVRQVWYESKDGTRIPMFLVHATDLALDGNCPTFLTGYGGFNLSMTPYYSNVAVVIAEQGGVFALPSLRGGGEFGEDWHRAGIRANKQNVFDDFLAAADWLIAHGITNPDRLAISGGSNGGLLVGAALTQRPERFRAVVCSVPLLDMVRYHQFLVAGFWIPEYGSAEDPDQFFYLYAYSPYHRVQPGTSYPAILFVTGDSDTRVAPLHARKMAARLQSATHSDRPILLHYDIKAGHAGGQPLHKAIADTTDWLGFVFQQLGIPWKEEGRKQEDGRQEEGRQ